MLTKEECLEALETLSTPPYESSCGGCICGVSDCGDCPNNKANKVLNQLIDEHFDNPPKVKFLEKALDIAIKDLCFSVKGADTCQSLDDLYEGIRDRMMEQARKEVQE